MEALTNLVNNIPDWLQKLDELNGKIEQRQLELAQWTETQAASGNSPPSTKPVRNKGSTESLKPRDEPAAHPRETTPLPEALLDSTAVTLVPAIQTQIEQPEGRQQKHGAPSSPSDSQSPSAIQRQTNQVRAAGQARARATLRKRQRTDSVMSAEGQAPKYRTRSMIIVYYDSYVQSFFEELVKFVSASRNMMRKAKMAAKVAQIKRLAELEMPDDSDDDANEDAPPPGAKHSSLPDANAALLAQVGRPAAATGDNDDEIPALRFVSTRGMQPTMARTQNLLMSRGATGPGLYPRAGARGSYRGGPGGVAMGSTDPPDVYDELDKGLEYVQSMCEHAAHQFLRDGDCAEEVANIQRRMGETKELADKEMERVKKEDPEGLKSADESLRGRSYRPQSMRKITAGKPASATGTAATKLETAGGVANGVAAAANKLEVDDDDGDSDMDDLALPRLAYKNTRLMR
ncbi:hypothetical protein B0H66DRAFT_486401 [Apodospora peruviana]|uniref:Uncharacterized protein n=1 Tax=Apodospora peruviana TaxID=516989 RepID=A0AAE0HTN5_9PEZI|nr:hypothetical protein B0H66DRAFT_486401 [Apodospora peruviana]